MNRSGVLVAAVMGGLFVLSAALPAGTAYAATSIAGSSVPEAPVPGYTPRFVTQTDERPPWNDCLWASGAMLLDKWTNGAVQPDRERLRRASRDMIGGSNFSDLARAVQRAYGWRPGWSGAGGDPLTWNGLLDRLSKGGGAVIAGTYGRLGSPYTRWDRAYAADKHAPGHAVYVERYDAAHGRIWLMDPLGRGGYSGEWIPVSRIRSFIWVRHGFVSAMATPPPPAKSTTGWLPGPLSLAPGSHRTTDVVQALLPVVKQGPWPLPGLTLSSKWQLLAPDQVESPAPTDGTTSAPDATATTTQRTPLTVYSQQPAAADSPGASGLPAMAASMWLLAEVAMPDAPGLWRLTPTVERGDGRAMTAGWQIAPMEFHVYGERGAVIAPALGAETVAAGQGMEVSVTVEDAGSLPWVATTSGPQLGEAAVDPSTSLAAEWVSVDGTYTQAAAPIDLVAASGQQQQLNVSLLAPALPGTYVLHFDVRDGQGSLLAREDTTGDVPVVVGPAPVTTLPPTQNQ